MALECIDSSFFTLNYQESVYRGNLTVQSYKFTGYLNGSPVGAWTLAGTFNAPKTTDIITTNIEERPIDAQWMFFGTTSAYSTATNQANSIGAFMAWANALSPVAQVIQNTSSRNRWAINDYSVDPNNPVLWNTLSGISNANYRTQIASNDSIASTVNYDTFRLYPTLADVTAAGQGIVATGLVLTHQRVGRRRFNINGYVDGVYLGFLNIDTNPSDFFIAPLVRFSSSNPIGVNNKSATFSKLPAQAVEVLIDSLNANARNVYLSDLDVNGNVIKRTLVFSFQTATNQPAPTYSITCGGSGECPPGTCKVICGSMVCCYGSDGIAVDSFPL